MVSDLAWQLVGVKKFFPLADVKGAKDSRFLSVASNLIVLNKKSDFDHLKKKGKRLYPCDWMIVNYVPNPLNKTRCGWVISRKIGKATLRNKMKRWCREFFREVTKQEDVKSVDINVVLREKDELFYKKRTYKEFKEQLLKAWTRI